LYAAITGENASIEKEIAAGNNKNLLQWLNKNIHRYARYYTSEELCRKATGETLNSTHFIRYATKKYTAIYIS
jgi:carboxypeptidase Taq